MLTGPNGSGKTSVLEAIGFLATRRSFRGSPREAMVRGGSERGFVRAEIERDGAPSVLQGELALEGRSFVRVNGRSVRSSLELSGMLAVTVFVPEDLALVQGGPGHRRMWMDEAMQFVDPPGAAAGEEVERILRQRGALLRQARRGYGTSVGTSLDVWDERLGVAGEQLAAARARLVETVEPEADGGYQVLARGGGGFQAGTERAAEGGGRLVLSYHVGWEGRLRDALRQAREEDLRRGITTRGPHRDDVRLFLDGREVRTQASQGEQRSVVVALRFAVHRLVAQRRREPPVLLLDDVFSELDPGRARALVSALPAGQALVTTAAPLPPWMEVAAVIDVTSVVHDKDGMP